MTFNWEAFGVALAFFGAVGAVVLSIVTVIIIAEAYGYKGGFTAAVVWALALAAIVGLLA